MSNTVLYVIDNDPIYQIITKKILEKLNLCEEIFFFTDGSDALKKLADSHNSPALFPDVILLDINMPLMDGWEFLDEFKQIKDQFPQTVRIYMVSSSIAQEDKNRASLYEEVAGFISKPLDMEQLKNILTSA